MIESQEEDNGLYRYMSAERCLQVLKDRKIRISSPLKFNDPFDGFRNIESIFEESILKSLYRYIERKYFKEKGDIKGLSGLYKTTYDHIKLFREIFRNEDDFEKIKCVDFIFEDGIQENIPLEFRKLQKRSSKIIKKVTDEINHSCLLMWNDVMYRTRVLCFSTQKYNVPLWCHYADKYSGVMLSFSQNTNLFKHIYLSSEQTKKVNYLEQNELTGLKEDVWHEFLWKISDNKCYKKFLDSILFEKSKHWEYEKEKRITFLVSDKTCNGLLYNDYELNANAIDGVYFGPEIKSNIKNELLALIRYRFPKAKVYQAHIKHYLKFEEIISR